MIKHVYTLSSVFCTFSLQLSLCSVHMLAIQLKEVSVLVTIQAHALSYTVLIPFLNFQIDRSSYLSNLVYIFDTRLFALSQPVV